MLRLFLKAYWKLIVFDFCILRGNFAALYRKVRACPTNVGEQEGIGIEVVCSAIDLACIWYWKEVPCLQRSAAATCLLRGNGIPAQMIIAAQQMPFKAHAWVEVEGRVVNDKPYMPEIYAVLDRC